MREDVARLLLRLMLGMVFAFHASQKLFGAFGGGGIVGFTAYLAAIGTPVPQIAAWMATAAETVAAAALILGWRFAWTLPPAIGAMFFASFIAHGRAFNAQKDGMEYTLTLAFSLTTLLLLGPGRYSATNFIVDRRAAAGLLKN